MQPPPWTPRPEDGDPTIGMGAVRPPPPHGSNPGTPPPGGGARPAQAGQPRSGPQPYSGAAHAASAGPEVVQGVVEPPGAGRPAPFFARRPKVVTPPGATAL